MLALYSHQEQVTLSKPVIHLSNESKNWVCLHSEHSPWEHWKEWLEMSRYFTFTVFTGEYKLDSPTGIQIGRGGHD